MPTLHVLVDNTAHRPELLAEHGLAMALDLGDLTAGLWADGHCADGHCAAGLWLWDAGASGNFLENARLMGVAVHEAKGLALSHGHWDHTGGLAALRNAGFQGTLHAHPDVLLTRYSIHPGKPVRDISWRGGDESASLQTIQKQAELAPGLEFHSDIPRQKGRFQAVENFFLDPEGNKPDPVRDDACLLLAGSHGPAVILGCCHSGLANTLEALSQRTGLTRFASVVGGLHLMNAPESAVRETAQTLAQFDVQQVYAGHCTGDDALEALQSLLPGQVHPLGGGRVLEL